MKSWARSRYRALDTQPATNTQEYTQPYDPATHLDAKQSATRAGGVDLIKTPATLAGEPYSSRLPYAALIVDLKSVCRHVCVPGWPASSDGTETHRQSKLLNSMRVNIRHPLKHVREGIQACLILFRGALLTARRRDGDANM